MQNKKELYLNDIADSEIIKSLLVTTLNEILEIKDRYKVVPFSWPGWPTADYISKTARKISEAMEKEGERLGKEKYNNFNSDRTKLTPEILEEIWMKASQAITEEIWAGFEAEPMNEIPSFERDIKKGAIMRNNDPWNEDSESKQKARDQIKTKASKANFNDDFLRKFKNKYFEYIKENFGLFNETSSEFKLR
ncbi:MAG TPA: hypothetical protein VGO63_02220 [Candidatus Paceibacterota bacterium]|jgi:hypothetical protein|nr:hypothetical protein [Candidatus Paceibacterota bacterium]